MLEQKESMPRSYPHEFRRKVLDLLAAGRGVTEDSGVKVTMTAMNRGFFLYSNAFRKVVLRAAPR